MTILLCLITAALAGYGIFNIATEFVQAPTGRARKAILAHKKGARSFSETIVIPLAEIISKHLRLSEARKSSLQKALYSAELHMTPEFYTAKAMANGIVVAAFAIPMLLLIPFLSIACLAGGVVVFTKEMQWVDTVVKNKREKIEQELVLFSSTIQQCLASSRDVIKIFESYRKVCGPELTHELDITLADMRTGSYENALRRFEGRLNSAGISQLVRGLLAVMRGDEQQTYFEMLAHDLLVEEKERLKRDALARPKKMQFASFLMMICFMLVYFYAIGYQVVTSLAQLF